MLNVSERIDNLNLVEGREFAPRTPHSYAHPVMMRLCEVQADANLQDTIEFEPVSLPDNVVELRPQTETRVA